MSAQPEKPQVNSNNKQQKRPARRSLSESEIHEIVDVSQRVPGLGYMVLSLVRNRTARVMVPETALGKEMLEIIGEFDRLSNRATMLLTRNLSPEKMAKKAELDMRALNLIQPLAQMVAELGAEFDNKDNPIIRNGTTRRMRDELRAERKNSVEKADGERKKERKAEVRSEHGSDQLDDPT